MKIKIERIDSPCETEITIKCGTRSDADTTRLLQLLQSFERTAIGYRQNETFRIPLGDILYIDSVDEKTFLYLVHEVYESPQKLYEWENQLKETSFVRVSKSAILNTAKLQSVRPLLSGKMEATLENGEKLIVNRHYVPAFRQKFGI